MNCGCSITCFSSSPSPLRWSILKKKIRKFTKKKNYKINNIIIYRKIEIEKLMT